MITAGAIAAWGLAALGGFASLAQLLHIGFERHKITANVRRAGADPTQVPENIIVTINVGRPGGGRRGRGRKL